MFSKPQAKAVAKPKDVAEAVKVRVNLAKKYPDMGKEGWGKPAKKAKSDASKLSQSEKNRYEKRKAGREGTRTKDTESSLSDAGLTAAEIKRLKGE
jgi:hypothetical protein